MRRALVLTDERARHPFRASLPPHVRLGDPGDLRKVKRVRWFSRQDLMDFLTAYCACFIAVSVFVS